MHRRQFLTGGSIAALLALTVRTRAEAQGALVEAAGAGPGTEYLVLDPSSSHFRSLTQGFNRRWSAPNAEAIFVPLSEHGAAAALQRIVAGDFGDSFRIRGGGHCYEDFVFNPETRALIDMSLLNDIGRDPASGAYYAEAGATNGDIYRGLHWRFGRTLPAGSCYSVGAGGHISGGGYGLLSRRFGLTVDWLSGVRVATVDASGHVAIDAGKRDGDDLDAALLNWAHCGGGGGNFGLITRYEFADLPVPPQNAELIVLAWNWTDIAAHGGASYLGGILAYFEELTREGGDDVFGLLKLNHQSSGQVKLLVQANYDGPPGSGSARSIVTGGLARHGIDHVVAPVGPSIGHPVSAQATSHVDYRWWEIVQQLNGSGDNQKGKYKSAHMRAGFPDDQVRTIYKYLTETRSETGSPVDLSSSLLQVDSYGGAINRIAPDATAVWQRSSIFKLQYQTYWQDRTDGPSVNGDRHIAWIRDFYDEMYAAYGGVPDPLRDPANNVDGCYINYPDSDLNEHGVDTALRLYYAGNLARLKQAKARFDPQNRFRHAQSVTLPS